MVCQVVLDVDETLVCAFKPSKVPPALQGGGTFSLSVGKGGRLVVFQRPGLSEFLLRLSSFAEIVAFTAGMQGTTHLLLSNHDILSKTVRQAMFVIKSLF